MPTDKYISDELLASFIDGGNSVRILEALKEDSSLLEQFRIASMAAELAHDEDELPSINIIVSKECLSNVNYRVAKNEDDSNNDICAIRSEQLILSHLGIDIPSHELIELSVSKGWYSEGRGTHVECVGNIVSHYGFETEQKIAASIDDIRSELVLGNKVMLCVDSGELIGDPGKECYEDIFLGEMADHVVVVSGLTSNDEIVIYDFATPQSTDCYPLQQLLDAWQDSGFYMIIVKK